MPGRCVSGVQKAMYDSRIVLCAASAYQKKYYLNEDFISLPKEVQQELQIMCVLFTEEVGGIIRLLFDDDGQLLIETEADPDDILYDEIGSGLKVAQIRKEKKDLFEALETFYQVFI